MRKSRQHSRAVTTVRQLRSSKLIETRRWVYIPKGTLLKIDANTTVFPRGLDNKGLLLSFTQKPPEARGTNESTFKAM